VHAQCTAAALGENGKIAAGLRGLDYAEGKFLAWHGQVVGVVAGDLQEDAAVRAAFVGLASGMKERGPKPRQVATFLESRTVWRSSCKVFSFAASIRT